MTTLNTSKPQPNTEVDAAALSSNFVAMEQVVNGGLDASNWAAGHIFAPDKIAQGGAATGQYLKWDGSNWVPTTLPATTIPVDTTLPASPAEGDEVILVNNVDTPAWAWHLRYRSGINDSYKWICLGGSTLYVDDAGGAGVNDYGWTATGPTIYAPRSGIYDIGLSCRVQITAGSAGANFYANINGALTAGMPVFYSSSRILRSRAIPAGGYVQGWGMMVSSAAGWTATLYDRQVSIMPVRVA